MATRREMKPFVFPLVFALAVLISALIFYLGFRYDNKYTASRHYAENGVTYVDMQKYAAEPFLYLLDGWEFYGGRLLEPEEITGQTPDTTLYIGQYGGFDLGDPEAPRHGEATYRMTVMLDDIPRQYALELPEVFTDWRLYVNGELRQSVGFREAVPSPPEPWMLTFEASGTVELVVQVRDQNGLYSGMVYPPAFGSPQRVGKALAQRLAIHIGACAAALFIGLLCLAVGMGTRFRLPYGGLAALCLCFCLCAGYPVFQALGLRSGWPVLERLGTYGMYLCILWMHGRFCRVPKTLRRFACGIGGFVCVSVLWLPLFPAGRAGVYFAYGAALEWYKWLVAAYLLASGIRASLMGSDAPKALLCGYGVFASALVIDRLFPLYEPILLGWPVELAGFVLLLIVTGILWRDTVHTYQESAALRHQKTLDDAQLEIQREYAALQKQYLTRTERLLHETRNHLTVLRHYGVDDGSDRLVRYIDNLLEQSGVTPEYYTANSLLNALLTVQLHRAKELDVFAELELDDLPEQLPIADGDLAAIVMNLLDNALDACAGIPEPAERWLYLAMGQEKDCLVLRCKNAVGEETAKTQRGISHGHGNLILRETAARYGGVMEWEQSDDSYVVTVTLPDRRMAPAK